MCNIELEYMYIYSVQYYNKRSPEERLYTQDFKRRLQETISRTESRGMSIKDALHTRAGNIIISIILGLGLAALIFRKTCSGNGCVIVKGPNPKEVSTHVYKIKDGCYKYTPYVVPCEDSNPAIIQSS